MDETVYWLELLAELGAVPADSIEPVLDEANQLMAIFVATVRSVKRRINRD